MVEKIWLVFYVMLGTSISMAGWYAYTVVRRGNPNRRAIASTAINCLIGAVVGVWVVKTFIW